jgi:CrcB protein
MGHDILLVGLGGFAGSVARYLVSVIVASQTAFVFPLATFLVNVIGCLLIGVFFQMADRGDAITPEFRLLLMTGFCGGFTTFSAFSVENIQLLQKGEFVFAAGNILLSIAVGLAATWFGVVLARAAYA